MARDRSHAKLYWWRQWPLRNCVQNLSTMAIAINRSNPPSVVRNDYPWISALIYCHLQSFLLCRENILYRSTVARLQSNMQWVNDDAMDTCGKRRHHSTNSERCRIPQHMWTENDWVVLSIWCWYLRFSVSWTRALGVLIGVGETYLYPWQQTV